MNNGTLVFMIILIVLSIYLGSIANSFKNKHETAINDCQNYGVFMIDDQKYECKLMEE